MKTPLFFFLLTLTRFTYAQQSLPREVAQDANFVFDSHYPVASFMDNPPSTPVRTAAEWEEISKLFIAWDDYYPILNQIVQAAQTECEVVIVTLDSNSVKSYLTSHGTSLNNVSYLIAPTNTIWIRDYGQWCVYKNDVDSLSLIDWIYNRPRPQDDSIPGAIAAKYNLPIYHMNQSPNNICNTGGNFMVDGWGTAFASKLILDENDGNGTYGNQVAYPDHSEAEIDTLMKHFMGINRYIKMNTLPYDEIHHIDMHMKLLDEETLLVGQFPPGVEEGDSIEAHLQYVLSNYNSVFGTPYHVIRIPMPPSTGGQYVPNADYRTYANAVFVNKTVILPLYREEYDSTALRIWRQALPGYKIVGIDCDNAPDDIISLLGAIHCITKEVTTEDNLLITHHRLYDQLSITPQYQIDAWIKHKSGIASAQVFYRTDTLQPYQSAAMTLTNSTTDTWTGYIPQQAPGSKVYYYIHAEANSGKQQNRPMPAPAGYWNFNILFPTYITDPIVGQVKLNGIYPNPSHGITVIPVTSSNTDHAKIYLADMLGRDIKTICNGNLKTGDQNYFINTTGIAPGVYTVVIESAGNKISQKLEIQ